MRDAPAPTWYVPYEQRPGLKHLNLVVRTAGDPDRITPAVRAAIAAVDPRVALFEVRSQIAQIDELLVTERILAMLATIFAGLAATLAALGSMDCWRFSSRSTAARLACAWRSVRRPHAVVRGIAGDVWRWAGAGMVGASWRRWCSAATLKRCSTA